MCEVYKDSEARSSVWSYCFCLCLQGPKPPPGPNQTSPQSHIGVCNCLLLLEDGHKVQYSGFIYSRFWTMGKTQCVSDNRARLIWVLHIDLWEVPLTGDGWPFSNFSFLNSLLQLYYCLFEDWLNLFIWSFAQTVLPREQMRRDKMRKKTRWAKKSRKPRQYTKRRG